MASAPVWKRFSFMVGSWLLLVTAPRDRHGFSLGTLASSRIARSRPRHHAFTRVSRPEPLADLRRTLHG